MKNVIKEQTIVDPFKQTKLISNKIFRIIKLLITPNMQELQQ